jgi:type IV pilus assembly protein PilE
MKQVSKGFTLIELMIVVAVIGLLSAIAYPTYMNYVRKTHRAEIAQLLTETAQNMERYYSRAGRYSTLDGVTEPVIPTGNAWYNVNIVRDVQTFTLTAQPVNNTMMATDVCGSFQLKNTGERSNVGNTTGVTTAFCWGR